MDFIEHYFYQPNYVEKSDLGGLENRFPLIALFQLFLRFNFNKDGTFEETC